MDMITENVAEPVREGSSRVAFRLTERDTDLLKFIYEQKFATLEILYFRFFDKRERSIDPLPENLWVARQRIALLKRAGLLSSQRVYTDSKAIYLITNLGYLVLKSKRELLYYANPITEVDFRYFEHDKRVNFCRAALEKQEKCLKWFPDRYLRSNKRFEVGGREYKIPPEMIPDGVFISSKNERVAFELEFTPKKRERYGDKNKRYVWQMSQPEPLFHKTFIIACSDRIGKDLREFFRSDHFAVTSYEKLVTGAFGPEVVS